MTLEVADYRVEQMQAALTASVNALGRWQSIGDNLARLQQHLDDAVDRRNEIERELVLLRRVLEQAAEAIYDGTIRDPEGEHGDA